MRELTRPTPVRRRLPFLLAVALTLVGLVGVAPAAAQATPIYWGSWINGETYGREDAPFDPKTIDAFEANAGKRVSIVHWGQPWYWGSRGGYQPFQVVEAERVRARGSIPMISWGSWDLDAGGAINQPNFRLQRIIDGDHDGHLRSWARQARDWGYPLFVRFNHEMNGSWYPWSEQANGNGPGQFALMWRHVVDIFRQEGATNVTWVWAPNILYSGATPLGDVYPGNEHVDWAGISGYNWGVNPVEPNDNTWKSFAEVHRPTYDALGAIAPDKPVMISETASTEVGGSKAAWITDALARQVPSWPRVKALLWFNWNTQQSQGVIDWVIESSPSARSAFAAGIGTSHYAANGFGNLPRLTKVAPIGERPVPSPPAPPPGVEAVSGASAAEARRVAAIAAARRRGRAISLSGPRRCRRGRALCLRLTWRAPVGPPAGLRYWIRAREANTGRTIARRTGSMRAGRRRVMPLVLKRRPRCGRATARITVRASGRAPKVLVRRGVVRRFCTSPARAGGRARAT